MSILTSRAQPVFKDAQVHLPGLAHNRRLDFRDTSLHLYFDTTLLLLTHFLQFQIQILLMIGTITAYLLT